MFDPCKGSPEIRQKLMQGTPKELLLVYQLFRSSWRLFDIHSYVGRLSKEKSIHTLAPALEDERIRGRVHLAFVGDGPIREQLEKTTFGHLADCVSFHGFLTGENLANAYLTSIYMLSRRAQSVVASSTRGVMIDLFEA